jgi:fluoroquinolone transport system ATP-binding protein
MIKVQNLSYTYPGSETEVLHQLDFEIAKGEIFGFLGPSGAGKSTTQKILYKILHNFKGEVIIGDKKLSQLGSEYFEQIGVGFELPNHYLKLTGRENLELFGSYYKKAKLLDIKGLFELVALEDSIDQKVESYSKGMKMRLNFIRAIMHQPEILFFDEPTAGLDPINAHKLKQEIVRLKKEGKTIFVTTHDMSTADEICDRVSFIVDGTLQVTEAPSVLKHQHGEKKVKVFSTNSKSGEFPLDKLGYNEEFLIFLKENEIKRIHTSEATLEEVFINVTGKALHK